MFLRDTGGEGPVVMLLHGWMVTCDLNWISAYEALQQAGFRVLAPDHRGHGRGLRTLAPFRLSECAADAAAALRELGVQQAVVVGYSMGGAIAQLMARDHPEVVRGAVFSATAQHWQDPHTQRQFRLLGVLGMMLSLAPRLTYGVGFRRSGFHNSRHSQWMQAEMMRHTVRDIVEAGRELGRFDSRPWLGGLQVPMSAIVTSRDTLVPVRKQRELAEAAGGASREVAIDHLEVTTRADEFNQVLLEAVRAAGDARVAEAA
jgi:pimeloyl-ACP methyl ester carboxylesterase